MTKFVYYLTLPVIKGIPQKKSIPNTEDLSAAIKGIVGYKAFKHTENTQSRQSIGESSIKEGAGSSGFVPAVPVASLRVRLGATTQ